MSKELERHSIYCELIDEVARSTGEARLRVTGASMLPAVWPGDVITVKSCTVSDLQPGGILLYRRDGRLTAHRVESISGERVITKGDSQASVDPPVMASELVGQVVSISRAGRSIKMEQSLWQKSASWMLSRSDFLMRVLLSLRRRWQGV
jgi:signal peptidase